MKFILVVVFLAAGNGSSNWPFHDGVAMQEFSSKESCEAAAAWVRQQERYRSFNSFKTRCLPK
jgi:hypothetical protein